MGKFNEYTQKATPADNDTLMIYDATSKANKLSPFSGIWNWIVGKLTNAVISNLQTSNKTVVGALNELNSNRFFATEQTISGIKVTKGSTVEKKFEFPAKTGYTRHYILSSITGTGSNTAVINVHFSIVSVYAPMVDSEVSVNVMCIYTKD